MSEAPKRDETEHAPRPAAVSFAGFIVSLATQAASLLAEEKDPRGAQEIIAIIEMLKDKTETRRTAEETSLIDAVLFDLRMAYVARSRGESFSGGISA